MTAFFEPDAKQGDASFLSIPYLNQLPKGTVVLHQTRNPLEVIRSHMGIRFFADPYVASMYLAKEHRQILDFLRRHGPEIFDTDSEIRRCMRYWYYWNRFAERAINYPDVTYLRYRVEDMDLAKLRTILQSIAPNVHEQACRDVLDSISKNTNTRPRDTDWTWDKLPAGEDKDQIMDLARSYGYVDI